MTVASIVFIVHAIINCFRYELLLQEEKVLIQEILSFEKKLESWSTTTVVLKPPVAHHTANSAGMVANQHRAENVPPSVLAFEVSSVIRTTLCKYTV